jgi:hypothetical protein
MLYSLVEEFAGFGDHRTGTPVDRATRTWFATQLEARGARVAVVPYEFDRYVADASIVAGGASIRCVPLFYSGVGSTTSAAPFTSGLDVPGAGAHSSDAADATLAVARESRHHVAVIGTGGRDGRLVAINRPVAEPLGPPAVLVAGADLERCARGPVTVTVDAHVESGESATVVASRGGGGDGEAALVLTTPLTGWFGCAGERGTGIALVLELLAAMPVDVPVLVIGTTGHELGYLGLRDHLARDAKVSRLVVHLGAGLAAGDGRELGPLRVALVDGVAAPMVERLRAALASAELPVVEWDPALPADSGEGSVWRGRGAPVLSLVGWFERFHTPDDLPGAVTSPALLGQVAEALIRALRVVA